MQYSSIVRVQSVIMESVSFDVRKPSYGRKMEFDTQNAEYRDKVRELAKQHKAIVDEIEETEREFEAEIARQIQALNVAAKGAETDEDRERFDAEIKQLEAQKAPVDPAHIQKLRDLTEQSLRLSTFEYNPKRIAWGLEKVNDLDIDGQPVVSAADVIALAPEAFSREILDAINTVSGMTSEQLKNLPSPITFSALVGTTKTDMIASAASTPESTEAGTAAE